MGKMTQDEINVDLFDEVKRLKQENKRLKLAMKEFVVRVESKEIRSVYTYNLFKKLLGESND